jgi:hypothetical protein
MDHDGTFRHGSALLPGVATHTGERRSSYDRIVAPLAPRATIFVTSQRRVAPQYPFIQRKRVSIQRYKPRKIAVIACVNHATNNFGDTHAEHSPNQAGRGVPHCDGYLASPAFGAHPNIDGAKVAADSAAGTSQRADRPRETIAPEQPPQPLSDTALLCDCCLGTGRHAHFPGRPCSACLGTGCRKPEDTP